MNFIIENWKWVAVIFVVLGVLIAFAAGISTIIPDSEAIKAWSVQEAIFYSALVISFVIFVKS